MPTNENVEALDRARLAWNAGDLEKYLDLYSSDAVIHGTPSIEPGIAGIRAYYEAFCAAFPGSQIVFEDILAAGDSVVCRYAVYGYHDGHFQGIPPTGRQVSIPGITILRFAEGRCVERWNQADFLGLLAQLGALEGAARA